VANHESVVDGVFGDLISDGFISIGSSTPGRMTLILTDVPRGPFKLGHDFVQIHPSRRLAIHLADHITNAQADLLGGRT
jgi:hypothetical protein